MSSLTEQLKRDGHLLTKSPRPPKKRLPLKHTRISPISVKRKGEARVYSKLRREFLTKFPICLAGGRLMGSFTKCSIRASQIHHAHKRGKNYLNTTTWIPVCAPCHRFIEDNKSLARSLGLLA